MNKTELTLSIEEEKLEAMAFWLKKENATVQKKMDEALRTREYLDRKTVPARDRPRRPARNAGVPVGTEERPQE